MEPRPGFKKTTVHAWRMELEALGLGPISIDVRLTAVRKPAVEAVDNGLLALVATLRHVVRQVFDYCFRNPSLPTHQ